MTTFNIGAVNVEENDQRSPVKYEIPPGIVREIDPSQVYQRQMNEQSLVLDICNLQDGDARAAYRNVQFDVRTYKKLKMFAHAEEVVPNTLKDKDLTMFVRLGTDFVDNYYEYELPLDVTPGGQQILRTSGLKPTISKLYLMTLFSLKKTVIKILNKVRVGFHTSLNIPKIRSKKCQQKN